MTKVDASRKPGLLMVANWDSDVGYAWWLMESYWAMIASVYDSTMRSILAYPSISRIPDVIRDAPIDPVVEDFSRLKLSTLRRQWVFLKRNRVKLIYLSDKPARHWIYLAFRLAGVKAILVHDHTPGQRTAPTGLKRWFKLVLNRMPGLTADACIGATDYVRKRYLEVACMPEEKCYEASNGIRLGLPAPISLHRTLGIPEGRKVIVTAARANRYKGGDFALRALSRVKDLIGNDRWHYVFMGDGPHLEDFRDMAKNLGLEDNVSFPGRVEGVPALLQTATCAFHPSKGEVGYSLSILEYMLAGLPVIVPDNPSVSGATENNVTGIIYHDEDVMEAAHAIVQMIQKVEVVERMGQAAKERVREKYSLDETHRKLRNIFQSVLETGLHS